MALPEFAPGDEALAADLNAISQAAQAALDRNPPQGGATGQVLAKASPADWDLAWTDGGGGGPGGSDGYTFVQDTVPTATADGQTWFNTATGDSFAWYVDADGGQWVQDGPGAGAPAAESGAAQGWLSTSTGNLPAAWTRMPFNSLDNPTPEMAVADLSGVITAKKAGWYLAVMSATINTAVTQDGTYIHTYINRNGTALAEGLTPCDQPFNTIAMSILLQMAEGQIVDVTVAATNPSTVVRGGVLSITKVL